MNINELSIGNYINFNNQLYKIIKISYKGWLHLADTKGNKVQLNTDYRINVIQPVPLTIEILENNGFIRNKEDYDLYTKYQKVIPLIVNYDIIYQNNVIIRRIWNFLFDVTNNVLSIEDDPLIRIQYVHQLQNLLKLIGNHKEIII